jgi:DNA-binding SARP family transcriptional activator
VAALRVELLDGFRVFVDEREVPSESWRRSKAAGVVKLLALAPAHRLHREQVMDVLWPELAPSAAAANLRKALHYARRAVGDDAIVSTGDVLALPADGLAVDVAAWRAMRSGRMTSRGRGRIIRSSVTAITRFRSCMGCSAPMSRGIRPIGRRR